MTQLLPFDYGELDTETSNAVQQSTAEIKTLARRAAQDIIEIGTKLIEVKEQLGHGHWGAWLKAEFDWSESAAQKMMSVSKKFKSVNFTDLSIAPSALYMLAAPSVPDEIVSEVLDTARQSRVTYSDAKAAIGEYKSSTQNDVVLPVNDNEIIEDFSNDEDQEKPMNPLNEEMAIITFGENDCAPPKPHVSKNSGNNEWYTPIEYINAARCVMGGVDLDPASSDIANQTVMADNYFTIEDDGLSMDWQGRVWMNPPYQAGLIDKFSDKLAFHVQNGDISQAIVLVNNATETSWFGSLTSVAAAVCFPRKRVRFLTPSGKKGAPLQGQAVLYIGEDIATFRENFSSMGWIANVIR